jgi:RNA polymerase-binding transcription factor DksA/ribosome-associated translation inhibitor RaiA
MPDGVLQWYDDRRGEGRVVRGGREYPVRAADVEPHARVPGARVHFDVRRHEGVAVAVDVRLRAGTRVSRRQRRFGDMTGARRPDTRGAAPFAHAHPEMGHRLASQPHSVAERWAALVAANDIEGAMLLYAPDAVVHTGDGDRRGGRVHGWLSGSGLLGHLQAVETAGAGDHVVVAKWRGPGAMHTHTSWMRIAHGEIAEQWIAGPRPARPRGGPSQVLPVVEVVARDARAEAARDYAEQKVRTVIEAIGEPVLHARVKLHMAPDPAVERPARAEAAVDVNGQLVRAHVAAHTLHEAVDLLEPRLRGRMTHAAERTRTLHLRPPATPPGEWQHAEAPTSRPSWYDRPAEEREVVRRKTLALDEVTLDEAAFDMELLDLDFYLFFELATGVDAVLHRRPDGRLGLRRLHPVDLPAVAEAVAVVLEPEPAPTLTLDDAVEWVDLAGEPFVFFRNQETGRANIVYRRYDGHYGLITPADEPAPPAEPSTARRRLRDELARLQAVRDALIGEGFAEESEAVSVAETSTIDQHQADLGTETFERERDQSLLEDIEQEIADVRRAFVRLDQGTYGRCEACGTQIPDERLVAMPAARFCLEHQAAAEVITGLAT